VISGYAPSASNFSLPPKGYFSRQSFDPLDSLTKKAPSRQKFEGLFAGLGVPYG
jgi:hypothetical protein